MPNPSTQDLETRRLANIAMRKLASAEAARKAAKATVTINQQRGEALNCWFSKLSLKSREAIRKSWDQFQQNKDNAKPE